MTINVNISIDGDQWVCHNGMHHGDPACKEARGATVQEAALKYQSDHGVTATLDGKWITIQHYSVERYVRRILAKPIGSRIKSHGTYAHLVHSKSAEGELMFEGVKFKDAEKLKRR